MVLNSDLRTKTETKTVKKWSWLKGSYFHGLGLVIDWEYVDSVLTLTQPLPVSVLIQTQMSWSRLCWIATMSWAQIDYWCLFLHWVFLKSNYAIQLGFKKNILYAIITMNTQPSHDHRARQASPSTLQPIKTHSCAFNLYELPVSAIAGWVKMTLQSRK